ncbi:MAG: IclR family transcriptional regulator, partial [Pseudomonadales bacterium]
MPQEALSKRKNDYTAPALEKGLDILELLATEPEGLTLSHIASKLSRSVGQIFRMLAVLESRGYVQTGATSDVYQLTLKLFELSHMQTPIAQLTLAASPEMKHLARVTEQSCHLSIYSQGKVIIIAQESSPA